MPDERPANRFTCPYCNTPDVSEHDSYHAGGSCYAATESGASDAVANEHTFHATRITDPADACTLCDAATQPHSRITNADAVIAYAAQPPAAERGAQPQSADACSHSYTYDPRTDGYACVYCNAPDPRQVPAGHETNQPDSAWPGHPEPDMGLRSRNNRDAVGD